MRFSVIRSFIWLLALLILPGSAPHGAELPAGALKHAGDYTFGYYPYGWRDRSPEKESVFAVQTNTYKLQLNASKASIVGLAPVDAPEDAARALMQGNEILTTPDDARIEFAVLSNGSRFPAARPSSVHYENSLPNAEITRLFHIGKYLQHFDLQGLMFGGAAYGAGLPGANGWLEAYCWSDRLAVNFFSAHYESVVAPQYVGTKSELETTVLVPEAYDQVLTLGAQGAWTQSAEGDGGTVAMAVQNAAGAGLVVIAPDEQTTLRWDGAKRAVIALTPGGAEGAPIKRATTILVVRNKGLLEAGLNEARAVRAPRVAEVVKANAIVDAPAAQLPVYYSADKGWYEVEMPASPDLWKTDRIHMALSNPDATPRTVRLNVSSVNKPISITGVAPTLRDANGLPTGLPVQISKNWHTNPGWVHNITMVELPAGATLDLEMTIAYADWGGAPPAAHAQLALSGYGVNQQWDQMAIGSFGESICYDPDVNLSRAMIDDVRPLMVWAMGRIEREKWNWTTNVGGGDFLVLFAGKQKTRQFLGRQKTLYRSYGPVLTDVTYGGETPGGAIQSRIRTQSWRTDDYVRAIYTLRYDVTAPVENIERLAFFQLGADFYNENLFGEITTGNLTGAGESWAPKMGGLTYSREGLELPGEMPWVSLHQARRNPPPQLPADFKGAWANRGLIVRKWESRLGGQVVAQPHYSVYGTENAGVPSAILELAAPAGVRALQAGDYVEAQVEMLILPQKADDYYGPNEGLRKALEATPDSWHLVQREAQGNNLRVTAAAGEVLQALPVRIKTADGTRAEVTIEGGVGYTPITFEGLKRNGTFRLELKAGDAWQAIDQAKLGNDWWQSDYDLASGTWSYTFSLPLDALNAGATAHTLRFEAAAQ